MTTTSRKWTIGPYRREETVLGADGTVRNELVVGARIRDTERGVTYSVTLGRGDGRVWLRTLEVEPRDKADPGVSPALLRRIPVAALADYVSRWMAERERLGAVAAAAGEQDALDPDGAASAAVRRAQRLAGTPGALLPPAAGRVPTPQEVAAMLREGETRRTLAARYNRSPSTISDWIGAAYRHVPDQMPPRRRGRRPQGGQVGQQPEQDRHQQIPDGSAPSDEQGGSK